jgi:hypothetical protein
MCMVLPLVDTDVKPGKWRQDEDVCVGLATFSISVALLLIFMLQGCHPERKIFMLQGCHPALGLSS